MPYAIVRPEDHVWETRPHAPGEPARHVAELSAAAGLERTRVNLWRYEPGARGKRHVHAEQDETFLVLAGTLTMALGEPAERVEVSVGGLLHVRGGTPLQSANLGTVDLLVHVTGAPPDAGGDVLPDAL